MPSIVATMAALASLSQALIIPARTPQSTFSVPRLLVGELESIEAAFARALRKYSDVTAQNDTTGTVHASTIMGGAAYVCPVTIGEDVLLLDFDTGSSDLWVFGANVTGARNHTFYNTDTGVLVPNETWNITYGDGSFASGIVYTDTVSIGGATVYSQAVEVATTVSESFITEPVDGLLGLSWQIGNRCSPEKCETWFGNLLSSLPAPLFTADLELDGGSYDFGYIDSNKHCGDIAYTDVVGQGEQSWWDFNAGPSSLNSSGLGYSIMDTGTSLWLLQAGDVATYYAEVPGAFQDEQTGNYGFPCNTTLPDVSVEIGGTAFTVPGNAMNFSVSDSDASMCLGSLQVSFAPFNIFGDGFMRNFFVVFDVGNKRLGVARQ